MNTLLIKTDITAVKLFREFVLMGVGSNLHIYEISTQKLKLEQKLLKYQKIHGIEKHNTNSKFIVFGGKQFTIIELCLDQENNLKLIILNETTFCQDWILQTKWKPNLDFALLSAHNVVEVFIVRNSAYNNILKRKLRLILSPDVKEILIKTYASYDQIRSIKSKQIKCKYSSRNNSILYSGLLEVLEGGEILVFAGTVFSEVIISTSSCNESLQVLKGHKGVIFSIVCCLTNEIIVTTSDDRSVRIWKINNDSEILNTFQYWKRAEIVCCGVLYGHTARVLRSNIIRDIIISVGEDCIVCFWDLEGRIKKKIKCHTNSCIWCLDSNDSQVVTGGGDGAVILHSFSFPDDINSNVVKIATTGQHVKKIMFTSRNNIIVLTEKSLLYFSKDNESIFNLNHKSSYIMLDISNCKQLIAVCDMYGYLNVFAENCKGEMKLVLLKDLILDIGKILSMHWLQNRNLVFCNDSGDLIIFGTNQTLECDILFKFSLPVCKERYVTSVAENKKSNLFIFGLRNGDVHFYIKNNKEPIKSFKKVHGPYGPNSITSIDSLVKTLGRDGSIKIFEINQINQKFKINLIQTVNVPFIWTERFIDKNEKTICGFREKHFIIFDIEHSRELIEINCGGGHRAWDICQSNHFEKGICENWIKFAYSKNGNVIVDSINLNSIKSVDITSSFHSKEINCMEILKNKHGYLMISGSEDTNLYVSFLSKNYEIKQLKSFKTLSSIRTVKLLIYTASNEENVLVISGGGRALIHIKLVKMSMQNEINTIDLGNYEIARNKEKCRKDTITDIDAETRIMSIEACEVHENFEANLRFLVIVSCSNGDIRIFKFEFNERILDPLMLLNHHKTCILNLQLSLEKKLFSMTTTGELAIMSIESILNNDVIITSAPYLTRLYKAGINSCDLVNISDELILLATGGDNNEVHLSLFNTNNEVSCVSCWHCDNWHCSQITGIVFYENFLITASIDQRVTLAEWNISNNNSVTCKVISQYYTDVSDVQGVCLVDHIGGSVCIYGKGFEIIHLQLPK